MSICQIAAALVARFTAPGIPQNAAGPAYQRVTRFQKTGILWYNAFLGKRQAVSAFSRGETGSR